MAGNSDYIPIYTREIKYKHDKEFNFKQYINAGENSKRDKSQLHFEHLIENIQEALTPSKCKMHYDNSYLEFLGDGVLSMLLAWDLIMKQIYKNTNNQGDIDTLRIQNSSSRKLIELCKDAEIFNKDFRINQGENEEDPFFNFPSDYSYLYEYIVKPIHKNFDFFQFPLLNQRYDIQILYYENHEKAEKLNKILTEKSVKFYPDVDDKSKESNKNLVKKDDTFQEIDKYDDENNIQYKEDYFDVAKSLYKELIK